MEVDATRAGRVSPLWAAARVQQALGEQDEWRLHLRRPPKRLALRSPTEHRPRGVGRCGSMVGEISCPSSDAASRGGWPRTCMLAPMEAALSTRPERYDCLVIRTAIETRCHFRSVSAAME
jgi:hypothetical protein